MLNKFLKKMFLFQHFAYHCVNRFCKVFAKLWIRYLHRENALQEMLLQGFTKLSRNFSGKYSLKNHFMKYYQGFQKDFLKRFFLLNCKKIFLKPSKNFSRKVITKPFKNILHIITWTVFAMFSHRF